MSEVVAIDVGAQQDPVAAVFEAHRSGALLRLRTSGSTKVPRVVIRTTDSWFDSFETVARLTGLGSGDRMWLPAPLTSTMSLFAAVLAESMGATWQTTPEGATHAHLTPLALADALDQGLAPAGLSVAVAGDRLPARLRSRAYSAGLVVAHYYGAAELSYVAWGTGDDDLRPFPGVELQARAGEIWVRSPYLCEGYDHTVGTPDGALRRDDDGFVTVGDRGVWDGSRLAIVGRGDLAVNTGGATVLVDDVERALTEVIAGQVVVLGLPHDGLGEVLSAALTDPADFQRARSAAGERLDPAHRPRKWFLLDRVPSRTSGKVDRDAVRDILTGPEAVPLTVATQQGAGR